MDDQSKILCMIATLIVVCWVWTNCSCGTENFSVTDQCKARCVAVTKKTDYKSEAEYKKAITSCLIGHGCISI